MGTTLDTTTGVTATDTNPTTTDTDPTSGETDFTTTGNTTGDTTSTGGIEDPCPSGKLWTLDADWDSGTFNNVNHDDPTTDQLQVTQHWGRADVSGTLFEIDRSLCNQNGASTTVLDVLTVRNIDDLHGVTCGLQVPDLDSLVAYLLSLDGSID